MWTSRNGRSATSGHCGRPPLTEGGQMQVRRPPERCRLSLGGSIPLSVGAPGREKSCARVDYFRQSRAEAIFQS